MMAKRRKTTSRNDLIHLLFDCPRPLPRSFRCAMPTARGLSLFYREENNSKVLESVKEASTEKDKDNSVKTTFTDAHRDATLSVPVSFLFKMFNFDSGIFVACCCLSLYAIGITHKMRVLKEVLKKYKKMQPKKKKSQT